MTFDWSIYKGDAKWLPERTIYMTVHGSRAYGTNLPSSDTDWRGVCIAPKQYYLGFMGEFEQEVQEPPLDDLTVYDLRKFLSLAVEVNPNVIELLYTDPKHHVITSPAWQRIQAVRDTFLSKQARFRFSKYALSQLKRIETHYRWLKNPPLGPPTRAEFGLPERTVIPADQLAACKSQIQKKLDQTAWHEMNTLSPSQRQAIKSEFEEKLAEIMAWSDEDVEHKVWRGTAASLGYDTNFIELLDMERRYGSKQKDWESYQKWKKDRNVERAALEAKFGYDTKHALHLVRLLRMCREILTEGVVNVWRPDFAELLEIRAGAWTYEQLVKWAIAEDKEMGRLMLLSKLPNEPDRAMVDKLCQDIVFEDMLRRAA